MDKTTIQTSGMGFTGWLTIIFVIAKLTGYINWSWWWVFSPLLISWSILLGIVLIACGVAVACHLSDR